MPKKSYEERKKCIDRVQEDVQTIITKSISDMFNKLETKLELKGIETTTHNTRMEYLKYDTSKKVWNSLKKYPQYTGTP